jgi:hypothetical protein
MSYRKPDYDKDNGKAARKNEDTPAIYLISIPKGSFNITPTKPSYY